MKSYLALLLIGLSLGALTLVVNKQAAAPTHARRAAECTRYCHDHGCPHASNPGEHQQIRTLAFALYHANVRLLQEQPWMSYREINLFVYVLLWPLLIAFLAALLVYRARRKARTRSTVRRGMAFLMLTSAGLIVALLYGAASTADISALLNALYWHGTDFCINLANLLDVSYTELNILLFIVMYPAVTLFLILMLAYQRVQPGTLKPDSVNALHPGDARRAE